MDTVSKMDTEMLEGDEVRIKYGDQELTFEIDDIEPEVLSQAFDLKFVPSILKNEETQKIITIPKNVKKLKPGETYCIPSRENPTGLCNVRNENASGSSTSNWEKDFLPDVMQNAVVASKAVYLSTDEECRQFLVEKLSDHNFELVFRSQNGRCPFLVAEEVDRKQIYIAFRGTDSVEDWKDNLKAYQSTGLGISAPKGKFHAGFLERALAFPIEKILNEDKYKSKQIIICGHSLGGAVATIVSILTTLELEKRRKAGGNIIGTVKCFTFGAPFIGDGELRRFCDENGISKNIYHSVSFEDPVPRLLSYGLCLQAMATQLDNDVKALVNTYGTKEGTAFYEEKKQSWISKKMVFLDLLANLTPALDSVLTACCCIFPQYQALTMATKVTSMAKDIITSVKHEKSSRNPIAKNVYTPLGNYLFLTDNKQRCVTVECNNDRQIEENMELSDKVCLSEQVQNTPVAHGITNYESTIANWRAHPVKFPETKETMTVIGAGPEAHFVTSYVMRDVKVQQSYVPEITAAELIKITSSDEDRLRLRLIGTNLFHAVLDKCQFNFGFPFGKNREKLTLKQMPMSEFMDVVILEEAFHTSPQISDLGTELQYATLFGTCTYQMSKDQVRNLAIPNVHQLSYRDSVSTVLKTAIQRGMAMAEIKRKGTNGNALASDEPIIREVKNLAKFCLPQKQKDQLFQIFDDNTKQVKFILSNEKEYERIEELTNKIKDYLKSPLKIEASTSVTKMIGVGISAVVGGALVAAMAGPGMVVIGAVEAVSLAVVGPAGIGGGLATGLAFMGLWQERLVDKNYDEVLKYIVDEMFKNFKSRKRELSDAEADQRNIIQEVTDLREDDSVYNREQALLLMYEPTKELENFTGTNLENCKESSKKLVVERIECIRSIHCIRNILAKQCYVGVVGIQDAGKTTLLNKIWGIGGRTGLFHHTEVPMTYQVNNKVYVVDFPGSNSLDYHTKTFSICGAMNNLILVLVPFTGDVNNLISEEVGKVFTVMQGSDSTQVILCINKCGPWHEQIKQELNVENPFEHLVQRFTDKLNDHYENLGSTITIQRENILFTDWMIGDTKEGEAIGLLGVEAVKEKIKDYLLKYNIYEKGQTSELEKCMSMRLSS